MSKFEMRERRDLNGVGKRCLYPCMKIEQKLTTRDIVQEIQRSTTFTTADLKGALDALAMAVAHHVAAGRSVHLDGFGTFSAALALSEGKEGETADDETRRNGVSVEIKDVRFRAERRLIGEANRSFSPQRGRTVLIRTHTESVAVRMQRFKEYLAEHHYAKAKDYALMMHLSQTSAYRELRMFVENPDSGITTRGKAPHKVYVLQS